MVSTSKENLDRLNSVVEMLKAIAHPVRISIIDLLEKNGRCSVSEIHTALNQDQPVISHHLSIMKSKNVVDFDKEGKHCFYYLKHENFSKVLSKIEECQTC